MGFTTPCFIRKNTERLRESLKRLGIRPLLSNERLNAIGDNIKVYHGREAVFSCSYSQELYGHFLDCGTNEALFLAIAALRDDTDDSQWFVYPPENIWFICDDDDINYARENIKDSVQAAWFHCSHKATVEELIEHFKGKEESCQDL